MTWNQKQKQKSAEPEPAEPPAAAHTGLPISVSELTKTFEGTGGKSTAITAVDGVTLDIAAGSTVALVGPSGSGKSTLLHLLGAIEQAGGGTVTVGNTEITGASRSELTRYRGSIGFVFQRFHLLPALTARDNVIAPLLPYSRRGGAKARAARADALLADVGLSGREDHLPSQLSGGQQQRVAITRALINEPGLLLADEPTGNLDSANGTEIIELLLRLNAERGMTLVIATHDPGIAARCGRTVSMRDGHVITDQENPSA